MQLTATREWIPDHILYAPELPSTIEEMCLKVSLDPNFILDLTAVLGLNETLWFSPHLRNGSSEPTWEPPTDSMGEFHYVLGWLTTRYYFPILKKWAKQDQFFNQLYRLTKYLSEQSSFSNSSIYADFRTHTNLQFEFFGPVQRGTAPFPELLCQTNTRNCGEGYAHLILWLLERAYQYFIRSGRTSVCSKHQLEMMSILRNLNANRSNQSWGFLGKNLSCLNIEVPYLEFRNRLEACWLGGAELLESNQSENSRRVRRILNKIDSLQSEPLIYLSHTSSKHSQKADLALINIIEKFANASSSVSEERIGELNDEDLIETDIITDEEPNNPKKKNKKTKQKNANAEYQTNNKAQTEHTDNTEDSHLLKRILSDEQSTDRSRLWQRSIEQSVWFFANPYFNDKIEIFVNDLRKTAKFDANLKQILITQTGANAHAVEIMNMLVWLRVTTSQSLTDLLKNRSEHLISQAWGFDPELKYLRRLRPQFSQSISLQLECNDPRIQPNQLEKLPDFIVDILYPFRGQLYPLLALISDQVVTDVISPTDKERPNQTDSIQKEGEEDVKKQNNKKASNPEKSKFQQEDPTRVTLRNIVRNLHTIHTLFKRLCAALEVNRGSWPEHSLRLLHNKYTRNLSEGQLLHSKPNELKDAASAYYQVTDGKGNSVAGSLLCPPLNEIRKTMIQIKSYLLEQIQSSDLIVSWNSIVDLVLLYIYVGTGIRPLQDPLAEIDSFDLDLKLAIVDDKQLASRDSARVIPIPDEMVALLRSTYLPCLQQLADRVEDRELAKSIQKLSELKGGRYQDIPFFFHLSQDGLIGVGESWLNTSQVDINLAPNFHRHAISNFLEVKDRELIDFLLGHQHLQIPIHGLGSLRTRKIDLDELRTALSLHLFNLGLDSLPTVRLPERGSFQGTHQCKIFGIEKRRQDRTNRIKKKIELVEEIVFEVNLEPIESRESMAKRKLLQIRQSDVFQGYLDIVIPHFASRVHEVDLDGFVYEINRRFEESNPISIHWMKTLKRSIAISNGLNTLLQQADQYKSASDLSLLLAISLIANNGVTDHQILIRIFDQNYQIFQHQNQVYMEFSFDPESEPNFAVTRRHTLTDVSIQILIRLENKQKKPRAKKLETQLPSEDLRKRFHTLGVHGKTSFMLIHELIKLEMASQIYELPTSLGEIASGEIQHRSVDRASLLARTTGQKIIAVQPTSKFRYIGKRTAGEMVKTIQEILKISRSLVDQPAELIKTLEKLRPHSHPCLQLAPVAGLMQYVLDMFRRLHSGRALATSTKEKYLLKLQRIFLSTDLAALIAHGDSDAISEEIQEFLDQTARCGNESHEYARHIRGILDTKAIKELNLKVSVPYVDHVFNPRVTLYSNHEIDLLSKKLLAKGHLPALSLLNLYANYGLRTQEATVITPSKIHFFDDRSARIYIRGNSSKRLKTSSSNRIAVMGGDWNTLAAEHFTQQIQAKKNSLSSLDFFDGHLEEHLEMLNCGLQKYIGRGQLYCLRHYFANEVFWPVYSEALNLGLPPSESILGKLNGRPVNSHTLHFAGRLLGHASPRTTLTHYFHRGFDVIDQFYAKRHHLKVCYPNASALFNPLKEADHTEPSTVNRLNQRNPFQLCADFILSLVSNRPISTSGHHMMDNKVVRAVMLRISNLPTDFQFDFKGGQKQGAGIILNHRFLEQLHSRKPPISELLIKMGKLNPDHFIDSWTQNKLFVVTEKTVAKDLEILALIMKNLGLSLGDLQCFTKSDNPSDALSETLSSKGISIRCEPTRHTHVHRLDGQRVNGPCAYVDVKESVKVHQLSGDHFSVNRSVIFAESVVCAIICALANSLLI